MPGIHNNCKDDLKKFCSNVKPGKGRTHKCLRDNKDKVSKACKQAEFEQQFKKQLFLNNTYSNLL